MCETIRFRVDSIRPAIIALAGLLFFWGCEKKAPTTPSAPGEVKQNAFVIEPTQELAADAALLKVGQTVYARRCAPCHGATGAGDGEAAYLLYPKPRSFRQAVYRFGSTWEGKPTDRDLYVTISRGIPGSAMPSWTHLSERERWGLVHYIKSLADKPFPPTEPETEDPTKANAVIKVPPEPAHDAASLARVAEIYETTCMRCHGDTGRGDGPSAATLVDDDEIPIRPRDLLTGVFKGPRAKEDLYRRILRGIPGTPMPAHPHLRGNDAWHLVDWILSLSSERLRDRAEMKRYRITVVRVAQLPDHPDAGEWRFAPKTELHLMPIWWRYNRPEYLSVRAVHDGKEIAFQLLWSDATNDNLVIRTEDFRDAAALELAAGGTDPPFFAMGHRGARVNIWMWKAERQADLQGFHDMEAQYPNIGIDSYPNTQDSKYEQPMRHALTLKSNPTFISGWGAGNIVSDPERRSAAEDLRAEGFGTLVATPKNKQEVHATGVHTHGSYRVMFRRSLSPKGPNATRLTTGSSALVAFAIWNGSAGDRDGKKSVTIWQDLDIQP